MTHPLSQWLKAWFGARCKAIEPQLEQGWEELRTAFTAHPQTVDETYLEHLWFTASMAARFFYASAVILVHGLFPFLFERGASRQIEALYRIMKTRIPPARRDEIDADYTI
jgi:hypothetical protein